MRPPIAGQRKQGTLKIISCLYGKKFQCKEGVLYRVNMYVEKDWASQEIATGKRCAGSMLL